MGQVGGVIGLLDVATGGAIAQLPGKIGVLFWGGLVVPSAFVIYNAVSTFLFKDPLVLKVGAGGQVAGRVLAGAGGRLQAGRWWARRVGA